MALGLLSLLALFLATGLRHAVYVVIATLLIGALAAWLGSTAVSRARKSRTGRALGAVAGIVLGLLGLAFSGAFLIVFALFWNQLSAYYNCNSAANTLTAQQACQHQLSRTISTDFGPFSAKG